jgi:hypothetical protein
MHSLVHWILTWTGSNDTTGTPYGFWSGFGADLPIFAGIFGLYHKHNCHQKRCPRIGKHVYEGTTFCTKHHPNLGDQA